MTTHHSTADAVRPPRLLALDPAAPAAQLAEALFGWWSRAWSEGAPVVALVAEECQAGLLDALRRRFQAAEPAAAKVAAELREGIRLLTDRGACLIAGGEGRPALLANLDLGPGLLARLDRPLPLLAVGTREENPASGELPGVRPLPFGADGLQAPDSIPSDDRS